MVGLFEGGFEFVDSGGECPDAFVVIGNRFCACFFGSTMGLESGTGERFMLDVVESGEIDDEVEVVVPGVPGVEEFVMLRDDRFQSQGIGDSIPVYERRKACDCDGGRGGAEYSQNASADGKEKVYSGAFSSVGVHEVRGDN